MTLNPPTSHLTPTYLPHLSDSEKICTFADDEECPHIYRWSRKRSPGQAGCLQLKPNATMAKVTSLLGGIRGKASNMVFAKSGGQVIMREYNPSVSNPNTEAQVGQRTQFKLLSQLAAAMADVIVIPKQGSLTGRNRFHSINSPLCYYEDGVAQITYENIQLSIGSMGLPAIYANRANASDMYIELDEAANTAIDRVIYCVFKKSTEGMLQLMFTVIANEPGDERKFRASDLELVGELVIFAYGMRDLNESARAKYGNYFVENGEDIAQLVSNRSLSSADYAFTKTRGTTLMLGESESVTLDENQVHIYATATNGGSVSGAGVYTIGQNCTLTATPNNGKVFDHWEVQGNAGTSIGTTNPWTFEVTQQRDIVAIFADAPAGGENEDGD